MIKIVRPEDCCGCNACVQRCPKQCITMTEDKEGFLYPKIDESHCIDCGICNKVCPMQKGTTPTSPVKVLAAYNKNEVIRRESSSGGIFTLLAEKVIGDGGVVFGAEFNEKWEVILGYSETKQGIAKFRGSKYVQANVKETFVQCEQFLNERRKVLFSGTPCQIAGLKQFLGKDYGNLLTVDVVCHGVPSPKVWRKYIFSIQKKACNRTTIKWWLEKVPLCSSTKKLPLIKDIRFRDKSEGWKKFRFVLKFAEFSIDRKHSSMLSPVIVNEDHNENLFMQAFLSDLILRPSCYLCPFRGTEHRQADISIADYWGVDVISPEIYDDKGLSLVFANTPKAMSFLSTDSLFLKEVKLCDAINYNGGLQTSIRLNPRRDDFFHKIDKVDIIKLISKYTIRKESSIPKWRKLGRRVKDCLKRHMHYGHY